MLTKKIRAEIDAVMHIQLTDPSTKTDDYMQGLANGMIMIDSILKMCEPKFIVKKKSEEKYGRGK